MNDFFLHLPPKFIQIRVFIFLLISTIFSDSKETQEASKPPPPVKIKTPKKSSNNQKSVNKNAIADTTISVTERVDETSLHLRSSPTEGVNNVNVNVVGGGNVAHEKFAFSQLMRQMALKYQDKNETAER
jgi:hypothetical protein